MKRIPIAPTADRRARHSVEADPRWAALTSASTTEIDAYLARNVSTVDDMRTLLRSLLLAVRYLMQKQQPT